ncbi:MAG: O-antigen ligase family protein [Cytophagaceae bacterium]
MDIIIIEEIKSYVQKKWFWILIVLLATVLIAIGITNRKWIYFVILLIPIFIYLSIEKPFIFPFGFYVLLLPFDNVLSISGATGPTITKFLGILTIIVLLLKGLFEKKLKKLSTPSIYWLILIIYAILSIVWAYNPYPVRSILPTAIGLLSLYLIASSYKIRGTDFDTLKWYIVAGGFLSAIYTIYIYVFMNLGETRVSLNISEERTSDPNMFAFSLLLPASICIERVLNQRKKALKAILIVMFGFIISGILLTGSRGGTLGLVAIIVIYTFYTKNKLWMVTIFLGASIILMPFVPWSFLLERWDTALEGGGAGRTTIWYYGLKMFAHYWLIGAGLNNFVIVYSEFAHFTPFSHTIYRGSHNIYLQILVELGFVGFILFISGLIKHYNAIKSFFIQHNNDAIMLKAAFWSILISSFFLGTFLTKSFWLLFMMILMFKNTIETDTYKMSFSH